MQRLGFVVRWPLGERHPADEGADAEPLDQNAEGHHAAGHREDRPARQQNAVTPLPCHPGILSKRRLPS